MDCDNYLQSSNRVGFIVAHVGGWSKLLDLVGVGSCCWTTVVEVVGLIVVLLMLLLMLLVMMMGSTSNNIVCPSLMMELMTGNVKNDNKNNDLL